MKGCFPALLCRPQTSTPTHARCSFFLHTDEDIKMSFFRLWCIIAPLLRLNGENSQSLLKNLSRGCYLSTSREEGLVMWKCDFFIAVVCICLHGNLSKELLPLCRNDSSHTSIAFSATTYIYPRELFWWTFLHFLRWILLNNINVEKPVLFCSIDQWQEKVWRCKVDSSGSTWSGDRESQKRALPGTHRALNKWGKLSLSQGVQCCSHLTAQNECRQMVRTRSRWIKTPNEDYSAVTANFAVWHGLQMNIPLMPNRAPDCETGTKTTQTELEEDLGSFQI